MPRHDDFKTISKHISYVLRHRPDSAGLTLEPGGWVAVDLLLNAFARSGRALSRTTLEEVVAQSDKQRFELSTDRQRIRARQGHSARVDLGYPAATPPAVLYHGTATRLIQSILREGLRRGSRHDVHLSTDRATMLAVGKRHGKPILILVDAQRMHADGHTFHVTGNHVWLTEHVPPQYLSVEGDTP